MKPGIPIYWPTRTGFIRTVDGHVEPVSSGASPFTLTDYRELELAPFDLLERQLPRK